MTQALQGESRDRGRLATPRARIGVVIPTSNRMIEPQFQHYAPAALGVHFARARITGRWAGTLKTLAPEVVRAAETLADARCDLIVFNCTATSMQEGPEGDAFLLGRIREATGIEAISTAGAVAQALQALSLRRLVLVTPYVQSTNDHEKDYFRALGFDVARDVALGLRGGDEFIQVAPQRWVELALDADDPAADGFFMSCTNTSQIEAIEAIEAASRKPAVSANQAVLWASVGRLERALGEASACALPGRLARISASA